MLKENPTRTSNQARSLVGSRSVSCMASFRHVCRAIVMRVDSFVSQGRITQDLVRRVDKP